MTEDEKIRLDIRTLFESMRFGHAELVGLIPTEATKQQIIDHLKWCGEQLKELIERLERGEVRDDPATP